MLSLPSRVALGGLFLLAGCAVSTVRRKPLPEEQPEQKRPPGAAVHYDHAEDAPEISRGVGNPDAVVVLWPRIVPKNETKEVLELAELVQSRLASIAQGAGAKAVEKRPAPERVCPRPNGCQGPSLGAVVTVKDKACAVAVVVGPPGASSLELFSLAGSMDFKSKSVPFREPPESSVTITEFAKCDELLKNLTDNAVLPGQPEVEARLKSLISGSGN
jgi:hypothetical protein